MESIAQFFAQISTLSGRLFALKKEGQVPTRRHQQCHSLFSGRLSNVQYTTQYTHHRHAQQSRSSRLWTSRQCMRPKSQRGKSCGQSDVQERSHWFHRESLLDRCRRVRDFSMDVVAGTIRTSVCFTYRSQARVQGGQVHSTQRHDLPCTDSRQSRVLAAQTERWQCTRASSRGLEGCQ